ncbi:MAG: preprotein translocase subunit SecY [Chloroflexi bacterium]|nr:preprotein translocase subunit SecY [Chloroflexota bacterium]
MIQALRNAWRLPDVRNKLLFTIFILIVYQFAAHVPVVGVDRNVLRQVFESGSSAGNLIQVMNLLSGGAVANFSVIANGVYPYITASIIFQLLVPIVPALERIQREPGGQEKIQRYTYFVSIPMAVLQALGQISIFNLATGTGAEIFPGFGFGMGSDILLTVSVLTTMTAGTMFAIWLGELITEQGIGNGISIIIFAGIVALAPQNLIQLLTQQPDRALYNLTLFIVITLLSVVAVVVIQEGVRRVPVQYGRRVRGNRQFAQQDSFIPLRVNPVGMIPLIFAQSIITFPAIIASLFPPGAVGNTIQTTFGNQQGLLYWGTFFLMTGGFTFFYAEVMVGNQNLAENLQRNGGFIPGIRPGKRTEDFIKSTTRRITFVGAFFLGVIAIIPGVVDLVNRIIFPLEASAGGAVMNAGLVISGSGLIIVVGVVIDTMRQLEAQLVMRNYEGFMR